MEEVKKTLKDRLKELEEGIPEEETFQSKINNIEKHVKKNVSKLISRIHPNFTLHDIEHVKLVISNLDSFCRRMDLFANENAKKLSRYEIFLLLASAYLHDIGMILIHDEEKNRINENNDARLPRDELSQVIRRDHPKRSAEYIIHNKDHFNITQTDARHIGVICQGHGDRELSKSKYDERRDPTNKEDHDAGIRIRFLTAMLQLADELDTSCERAPDFIREVLQDWSMDRISQFHWMKHYYTGDVIIGSHKISSDNEITIKVPLYVPDKLHGERMKAVLENSINEQLHLVNHIFRRYCDCYFKLIPIEPDKTPGLETTPEDVFRAYFIGDEPLEILLIEDDVEWRDDFKKALGNDNCEYSIFFAHDKKSAIEKIKKEQYKLIILDLKIPDEDGYCSKEIGYSVLRIIKNLCPYSIVIVLSKEVNMNDSKRIKEYDIIYISKSEFYGDAQNPPKKIIETIVKENLHLLNKELIKK